MNRSTRSPASVLLLLALLFSCTVYKEYPIDIYKPEEVEIPQTAKKVALIYRNFKYPTDTLQHFYRKGVRLVRAKNDPENLDSLLVNNCLNELAKELKSTQTFQKVHIIPFSAFERHTSDHLPPLSPGLIQKISSTTHSDLLISLETFSYFFTLHPENFETPPSNEVITAAVWGIYDAKQKKQLERKTMIDTVFWNGYDNRGNFDKGYILPPRLEALQIASAQAGENYAKRFYASWETVNRMYSVPPLPDFSEAARYFEEGKWDRAIALWKKYTDDKNGKLAINARYNLALAYEMKDDIAVAEKWLDAAYELALRYRSNEELNHIRSYRKALEVRKNEISKLNK